MTVHLDPLQRKGFLERSSIARTMKVTAAGRLILGMPVDPADRFKALVAAVEQYRCLRRQYEELTTQPAMREVWKAMEPDLRATREQMFCLLPAEEP